MAPGENEFDTPDLSHSITPLLKTLQWIPKSLKTLHNLCLPDITTYNSTPTTLANFAVAVLSSLKHSYYTYLHGVLFNLLQISARM